MVKLRAKGVPGYGKDRHSLVTVQHTPEWEITPCGVLPRLLPDCNGGLWAEGAMPYSGQDEDGSWLGSRILQK
jgi:hypothetical protein